MANESDRAMEQAMRAKQQAQKMQQQREEQQRQQQQPQMLYGRVAGSQRRPVNRPSFYSELQTTCSQFERVGISPGSALGDLERNRKRRDEMLAIVQQQSRPQQQTERLAQLRAIQLQRQQQQEPIRLQQDMDFDRPMPVQPQQSVSATTKRMHEWPTDERPAPKQPQIPFGRKPAPSSSQSPMETESSQLASSSSRSPMDPYSTTGFPSSLMHSDSRQLASTPRIPSEPFRQPRIPSPMEISARQQVASTSRTPMQPFQEPSTSKSPMETVTSLQGFPMNISTPRPRLDTYKRQHPLPQRPHSPPMPKFAQDDFGFEFLDPAHKEYMAAATARADTAALAIDIRNVWRHNMAEAVKEITDAINDGYTHIAVDTEFPGNPVPPVNRKYNNTTDEEYDYVKANVDVTNILQLGLSVFNMQTKSKPFGIKSWQFHFHFDVDDPVEGRFDRDAYLMLRDKTGLPFELLKTCGIPHREFNKFISQVGLLVCNARLTWISYQGSKDFSYMMRLIINSPLPPIKMAFLSLVDHYFPNLVDVKYMALMMQINARGGLRGLAERLKVDSTGQAHSAASDAELTGSLYRAMCDSRAERRYLGHLYGLGNCRHPMEAITYPYRSTTYFWYAKHSGRRGSGETRRDVADVPERPVSQPPFPRQSGSPERSVSAGRSQSPGQPRFPEQSQSPERTQFSSRPQPPERSQYPVQSHSPGRSAFVGQQPSPPRVRCPSPSRPAAAPQYLPSQQQSSPSQQQFSGQPQFQQQPSSPGRSQSPVRSEFGEQQPPPPPLRCPSPSRPAAAPQYSPSQQQSSPSQQQFSGQPQFQQQPSSPGRSQSPVRSEFGEQQPPPPPLRCPPPSQPATAPQYSASQQPSPSSQQQFSGQLQFSGSLQSSARPQSPVQPQFPVRSQSPVRPQSQVRSSSPLRSQFPVQPQSSIQPQFPVQPQSSGWTEFVEQQQQRSPPQQQRSSPQQRPQQRF